MVGIDAGFLSMLIHPDAKAPTDPSTGKPIDRLNEKLGFLVDSWNSSRERIIVPAPALAEFLVLAGKDGNKYLGEMMNLSSFYIQPFDQRAAIELAGMELLARATGSKRNPVAKAAPWQKVKFDRQIVAIAKLHGTTSIFSDDTDVRSIAEDVGLSVVSSWELTAPPNKTPLFQGNENTSFDLS